MTAIERANELHKELKDRGCLNYLSTSREIIMEYFSKMEDERILIEATIGKLEAKIFAYEAIISNSNFAMAIPKEEKSEKSCPDSSIFDKHYPIRQILR